MSMNYALKKNAAAFYTINDKKVNYFIILSFYFLCKSYGNNPDLIYQND